MKESQEEGAVSRGRKGLLETLRYNLWLFLSHFCLRAAFLGWLNPVISVSKTTKYRDSSLSQYFKFLFYFFLQKSRKHFVQKTKTIKKHHDLFHCIFQYLPFYSPLLGIITWINWRGLVRKGSYTPYLFTVIQKAFLTNLQLWDFHLLQEPFFNLCGFAAPKLLAEGHDPIPVEVNGSHSNYFNGAGSSP